MKYIEMHWTKIAHHFSIIPIVEFCQSLWYADLDETFYDTELSIKNLHLVELDNGSFDKPEKSQPTPLLLPTSLSSLCQCHKFQRPKSYSWQIH